MLENATRILLLYMLEKASRIPLYARKRQSNTVIRQKTLVV